MGDLQRSGMRLQVFWEMGERGGKILFYFFIMVSCDIKS
jgi:hypothetical protein